jgi:hypothetical protein
MRKAGDLLSVILDEGILKKAQGYHDLFSSWQNIAGEKLAAHSRIIELERSVLLIEADHPGWVQILQTKQKGLLNAVCRRFPELSINGIAFRLSRDPETPAETPRQLRRNPIREEPDEPFLTRREARLEAYEKINDEQFKETLLRLEKRIESKDDDTEAASPGHEKR